MTTRWAAQAQACLGHLLIQHCGSLLNSCWVEAALSIVHWFSKGSSAQASQVLQQSCDVLASCRARSC